MKSFKEWSIEVKNESDDWLDPKTRNFLNWWKDFDKRFPAGPYRNNNLDKYNLMIGRVSNILDELGESKDFFKYISNAQDCEKNYYMLLGRYIMKNHPEMYDQWKEEGGDSGVSP
jgi:hypothetical protein